MAALASGMNASSASRLRWTLPAEFTLRFQAATTGFANIGPGGRLDDGLFVRVQNVTLPGEPERLASDLANIVTVIGKTGRRRTGEVKPQADQSGQPWNDLDAKR